MKSPSGQMGKSCIAIRLETRVRIIIVEAVNQFRRTSLVLQFILNVHEVILKDQ